MDAGKEEKEVLRDMYGMFRKTRQIMVSNEDKEIGVLVPSGASVDKLRKVAEIAFRGSGLEVNLMAVKERKDSTLKKDREKGAALVVESTATTFADTLREVKSKITDESAINLLMIFKEGATKACKEVGAAPGTTKFRITGNGKEKTLKIRDIDALQREEDVKEVLMQQLGVADETRVTIKPLRPAADGNQVANVVLEASLADKLMTVRRVKIGLSLCRVQERVDPLNVFPVLGVRTLGRCL